MNATHDGVMTNRVWTEADTEKSSLEILSDAIAAQGATYICAAKGPQA